MDFLWREHIYIAISQLYDLLFHVAGQPCWQNRNQYTHDLPMPLWLGRVFVVDTGCITITVCTGPEVKSGQPGDWANKHWATTLYGFSLVSNSCQVSILGTIIIASYWESSNTKHWATTLYGLSLITNQWLLPNCFGIFSHHLTWELATCLVVHCGFIRENAETSLCWELCSYIIQLST